MMYEVDRFDRFLDYQKDGKKLVVTLDYDELQIFPEQVSAKDRHYFRLLISLM